MLEGTGSVEAVKADDKSIVEPDLASFRVDVIAYSARIPTLVAFWSPQSPKSRELIASLEKLARAAAGKFRLAKVNIDQYPEIPGQLGVQSIPAAVVFQKAQAIDGFAGAPPDKQVKSFLERFIGPIGGELEELIAEGDTALAAGDAVQAAEFFSDAVAIDAADIKAIAGLARARVATGELDAAADILSTAASAPDVGGVLAAARAALELATRAKNVGDFDQLEKAVAADPKNHQARYDLAVAYNAAGRKEDAADSLLEIIRRDRAWNDDAARKQLLQLFEAWGYLEPETVAARRKLSAILFS